MFRNENEKTDTKVCGLQACTETWHWWEGVRWGGVRVSFGKRKPLLSRFLCQGGLTCFDGSEALLSRLLLDSYSDSDTSSY